MHNIQPRKLAATLSIHGERDVCLEYRTEGSGLPHAERVSDARVDWTGGKFHRFVVLIIISYRWILDILVNVVIHLLVNDRQ